MCKSKKRFSKLFVLYWKGVSAYFPTHSCVDGDTCVWVRSLPNLIHRHPRSCPVPDLQINMLLVNMSWPGTSIWQLLYDHALPIWLSDTEDHALYPICIHLHHLGCSPQGFHFSSHKSVIVSHADWKHRTVIPHRKHRPIIRQTSDMASWTLEKKIL